MIVAYVQFPVGDTSAEEMRQLFEGSAPKYTAMTGLIRKYYLLSEDGTTAGGVYLWETKEAAEAIFNDEWHAFIKERYSADPIITYYETPVIVDNLTHEILTTNTIDKVA